MGYTCQFCGKGSDEVPLYNDWPHDYLKMEGMACWECYHKQAIERNVAAFHLGEIGHNAGWTYKYTLADAILTALDETEDNMDQGLSIDADIGGSYTASLIVRNGYLYTRSVDLEQLMRDKSDEEKRALLEQIISQLTWTAEATRNDALQG